jgi:hypothetical protein
MKQNLILIGEKKRRGKILLRKGKMEQDTLYRIAEM